MPREAYRKQQHGEGHDVLRREHFRATLRSGFQLARARICFTPMWDTLRQHTNAKPELHWSMCASHVSSEHRAEKNLKLIKTIGGHTMLKP